MKKRSIAMKRSNMKRVGKKNTESERDLRDRVITERGVVFFTTNDITTSFAPK